MSTFETVRSFESIGNLFACQTIDERSTAIKVELYDGCAQGLGITASKFALDETQRQKLLEAGASFAPHYTTNAIPYSDLEILHAALGPESPLSPVASVLGIEVAHRYKDKDHHYAAVLPANAAAANRGLDRLGLKDRRCVDYHGTVFGAPEAAKHWSRGRAILAAGGMQQFHDRAIHLPGLALASPPMMTRFTQLWAELREQFPSMSPEMQNLEVAQGDQFPEFINVVGDQPFGRSALMTMEITTNYVLKYERDAPESRQMLAEYPDWRDELIHRANAAS